MVTRDEAQKKKDDLARKQEVSSLLLALNGLGLELDDLVNGTPRNWKTREKAREAAFLMAQDSKTMRILLDHEVLPLEELQKRMGLDPVLWEKNRKYILAMAVILGGTYPLLREYALPWERRINQNGKY